MTTIEIKQGIAEDGFDKSDLINICLDLCHQIECKANAEFIVRAVNAHDDLVNALSELIAARSDVYDAVSLNSGVAKS